MTEFTQPRRFVLAGTVTFALAATGVPHPTTAFAALPPRTSLTTSLVA